MQFKTPDNYRTENISISYFVSASQYIKQNKNADGNSEFDFPSEMKHHYGAENPQIRTSTRTTLSRHTKPRRVYHRVFALCVITLGDSR